MSADPAPVWNDDRLRSRNRWRMWWSHCAPVMRCRKELANTLTHAVGLVLSIIGAVWLLHTTVEHGGTKRFFACALYSAALVAVYAASTLSHLVHEPHWRRWFRCVDQGCIFLLIVGTYTPFGMLLPGFAWPAQLLVLMWALALAGFISKVFFAHRVEAVSIVSCIALGWLPTTTVPSFAGRLPTDCLWLMLAGGAAYTVGTLFLFCDRRGWFYHATWHLFVIAGSVFHYLAILWYVVA